MTTIEPIRDFLGLKRFAFVGVSREPKDFSRALFRDFLAKGYEPVPVHPDGTEVEGRRCFQRLGEIQPPVEGALFMTPPAVTDALVRECAGAGITRVWMYRGAGVGAATPETIRFCEANGMAVVPGECPYMFLPGQPLVHRLHGFVRRIMGSYPRAAAQR